MLPALKVILTFNYLIANDSVSLFSNRTSGMSKTSGSFHSFDSGPVWCFMYIEANYVYKYLFFYRYIEREVEGKGVFQ